MPQKPIEVLREARKLIVDKGWTQECCARDASGKLCDVGSRAAVAFCMIGAVNRVADMDDPTRPFKAACIALRSVLKTRPGAGLGAWNDEKTRTKEEVIDAFDRAIAWIEERDNV